MRVRFAFLSGARAGQVETFQKAYIALGRHPLSDVRFDVDRDRDVSLRHAALRLQGETLVVRDLGSQSGTYVNGQRISGDVALADGDVIACGPNGPAVAVHVVADEGAADNVSQAARASAERVSSPREPFPAIGAPRAGATTTGRVAAEVARQTRRLRRTTKVLFAALVLLLAAFAWLEWTTERDARTLAARGPRGQPASRHGALAGPGRPSRARPGGGDVRRRRASGNAAAGRARGHCPRAPARRGGGCRLSGDRA